MHQFDAQALFQGAQAATHHDRRDPLVERGRGEAAALRDQDETAELSVPVHGYIVYISTERDRIRPIHYVYKKYR